MFCTFATQPFKHKLFLLFFCFHSVLAAISFPEKPADVLYPFDAIFLRIFSQKVVGTNRFVGTTTLQTATTSLQPALIVKAFKLGPKMHA